MTQETREAIGKVRALIAQGWTQGRFRRREAGIDRYCLWGAVDHVCAYGSSYMEVRDAIAKVAETGSLVRWNDQPGRTQEEVLRLLDSVLTEGA